MHNPSSTITPIYTIRMPHFPRKHCKLFENGPTTLTTPVLVFTTIKYLIFYKDVMIFFFPFLSLCHFFEHFSRASYCWHIIKIIIHRRRLWCVCTAQLLSQSTCRTLAGVFFSVMLSTRRWNMCIERHCSYLAPPFCFHFCQGCHILHQIPVPQSTLFNQLNN